MTKRMLMDATHPEETRVAIVDGNRDRFKLEDLDFDLASKPILRGNIYLAKVMRIEPSLQAAFVDYGGNRHGFLPFSEIHPDYFRIPMADRRHEDGFEDDEGEEINRAEVFTDHERETEGEADQVAQHESGEVDESGQPVSGENDTSFLSVSPVEAPESVFEDRQIDERPAPMAERIAHPLRAFDDHDEGSSSVEGLITDFGNAAIVPPEGLIPVQTEGLIAAQEGVTEIVEAPQTVESVGGETPERVVRQHRPRYKIQEVIKRGQIMLIQVVKEERGNKGAALTTFLSLAGRYCVLMPNTDHGGGVSRKITNHQDRRRMKEILDQLEIPDGMAVILRTAGMEQDPPEIQRDLEYLLRLWDSIREQTLQSTAPSLIYEEANLIKRAVRDLHAKDISEILVAGRVGYERARDFMCTIMPDQVDKIKLYEDQVPLFFRYQVESQIDALHSPIVQLRSGGYLVINPTEALVSIDVNSGRATRERHIEETAVKTNLEAADEIARQLRLRDLAGLVVIDFIDMEDGRNNAAVERRLKEAMKNDRARLQIGRISPFGLLELSRQRLRPSLIEINYEKCSHCAGTGYVQSADAAALSALRQIEEEGIRTRGGEIVLHVPSTIALFILNNKREAMDIIERRYGLRVLLRADDSIVSPGFKMERLKGRGSKFAGPAVNTEQVLADAEREMPQIIHSLYNEDEQTATDDAIVETNEGVGEQEATSNDSSQERSGRRRGRGNRNRGRRDRNDQTPPNAIASAEPVSPRPDNAIANDDDAGENSDDEAESNEPNGNVSDGNQDARRRRRGRRGGRRRNGDRTRREDQDGRDSQPHINAPYARPDGAPHTDRPPVMHEVAPQRIPTSIHELDTTPRAHSYETPKSVASTHPTTSEPVAKPYEIVNPPVDKQKGGWWRRLTRQE